MKYVSLISLAVLLSAGSAGAQNRIELSSARDASTCSISEPVSPPIVQVHVFVTGSVASTAVRFRVPKPDCWVGATWLGDAVEPGMLMAGNSQTDWSVAFGVCADTPIYLGAMSYLISGQALPCCEVHALPAFGFWFIDCGFVEYPLQAGTPIIINPTGTCACQNITLAVEHTSWGRVKSLYR